MLATDVITAKGVIKTHDNTIEKQANEGWPDGLLKVRRSPEGLEVAHDRLKHRF